MECIKCKQPLPDGAAFCMYCGKKQEPAKRKHAKRANGTGNISKLSGSRKKPWLARKNGITIGTYATRAEAQKALERLTDVNVTNKFNMTFKQIYDIWLPEHEREIGESAKGNYKTALLHCEPLHDKRFRSLRTSDFQKVIIAMEEKGLSKSSCEKVLQLFGQLSEWAIREGIMQTNYAKFCTIVANQKSVGRVFPAEAITAIKSSTHPAADIVLILLATGCRGNELFSAELSECHDSYFIGGSKTKTGRNRIIPVSPIGLASYRKILAEASIKGCTRFIDGYTGNKTYSNFAKRDFKELMDQLSLEGFTPYDCRHTFATLATKQGIDKQTLRRILGHADLSTTDKYYTHLDLEDILSATSELDLTSAVCNKSATSQKSFKKQASKS